MKSIKNPGLMPFTQALLAALLFGISAPIAKLFLRQAAPLPLAACFYLGAGAASWISLAVRKSSTRSGSLESALSKKDIPWLAGAILAGGVAAPVLQLIGLRNTPASTASLLLNFESVTTALIAALIFKESMGRRGIWSIGVITLGCILLSWNGGAWGFSPGALGIIGACLLWGVDNNLSRQISGKDPVLIVGIKGSSAGFFSLGLALLIRNPIPAIMVFLPAMLLGALSYGLSLQLFMSALRGLGAARTSALFGTAPFIGTAISFLVFHEKLSLLMLIALPLMFFGAWLIFTEDHRHEHLHLAVEHDHLHNHPDPHHDHNHQAGETASWTTHGHIHQHEILCHSHQHVPDIHHRHTHPIEKGPGLSQNTKTLHH